MELYCNLDYMAIMDIMEADKMGILYINPDDYKPVVNMPNLISAEPPVDFDALGVH